jgi:hypothetical protein
MARYSGAQWRPLGSGHQLAMTKHDIICLHTMVGNLSSTDAMFKREGWTGTESHFGVGGKWGPDIAKGNDGKVFQWVDTTHKADANLDGWRRVISIETADNAPGLVKNIQDWTPKQLDSITNLVTWLCRIYDIPPVLIPDTKPGRRGIGYHRQGCRHSQGLGVPGFLVAGGEKWSKSTGKECPGPRRIAQLKAIVIPRVKKNLAPKPAKPKPVPAKPVTPPKEPTVAKHPLDGYEVVLSTQAQADQMNSNRGDSHFKIGSKVPLNHFLLWGGPGDERLYHLTKEIAAYAKENDTEREDRAAQLQRIEDQLSAISAKLSPPTPTEPGGEVPGETRTV